MHVGAIDRDIHSRNKEKILCKACTIFITSFAEKQKELFPTHQMTKSNYQMPI